MRQRHAFTLVELMVAIALVLILMLGVSQVFKTASNTISVNQTISDRTRDARAAQSVLAQDFAAIAQDAPYFIVHSETRAAFRNANDLASDRDYVGTAGTQTVRDNQVRTTDIDGNNIEGEATVAGEVGSPAIYNNRNHRLDIMAFFVRGLFHRATGGTTATLGATPFVAPMSSSEALVWLGQLRVANNQGSLTANQDPGAGTLGINSNNFFASRWVLGHEMILLKEPDSTGQIFDSSGASQIYIQGNGSTLSPLIYNSGDSTGTFQIENSRYDIAGTSIGGYRSKLLTYINTPSANSWWGQLMISGGSRFQVNPAIAKPITPVSMSQQSPLFMQGCSQVIIEFAGDYLSQDNVTTSPTYGAITDTYMHKTDGATVVPPANINSQAQWTSGTTDGVIDYVLVGPAGNQRKQTRWYGMPRDVNGNGIISIADGDVVPLRDAWQLSTYGPLPQALAWPPFERDLPTKKANYAGVGILGMASTAIYTAAFGPNDPKPKMVRITYVLDDPNAQTAQGQSFEVVFELP